MKRNLFKKFIAIGIIIVFFLTFIPTINSETNYHYNSIVIIFGKCNEVNALSLWWKIGLYIPVIKRSFIISANEEGETLNAIVLKPNSKSIYIDNENISIEIIRARGIFYWFGNSILFNLSAPQPVFLICKAKSIYVITY